MQCWRWIPALMIIAILGCDGEAANHWQGYVEGDSLYIGAAVSGRLEQLAVERGQKVSAQQALFRLAPEPLQSAQQQSQAQLQQAQANLADAIKGQRPQEIDVIQARLKQAQAAVALSRLQWERARKLRREGSASEAELDDARTRHDRDQQLVRQVEAELQVAQLGAREDRIQLAQAQVEAAQAGVAQTQWQLDQIALSAPASGLIEDVLYRPGEFVAAGKPVIVLLPPDRVRIPFYVPEPALGGLQLGQQVQLQCDGCGPAFTAPITYVSPQAEYTPPFIFSKTNRSKFVYRVEAVPAPDIARRLHVGQPVDVYPPATVQP